MAHELRTPLNSIIPMALNLRKHVTSEKGLFYLEIVINNSKHLEVVIEDALEMTRLENNTFTVNYHEFDFHKMMSDVVQSMNCQSMLKGYPTVLEINADVPDFIFSDEKRLKQVFYNLIGNSIKFTFSGSIRVVIISEGLKLLIKITDSGVGIKPEDFEKLFKFFGTLQETKKINKSGMGLGLTISKSIM